MAYDPNTHYIDPVTGFIHDLDTGQPTGLVGKPIQRVSDDHDWPKWVLPHASHIHQDNFGNIAVPLFPEFHVRRQDGEVTVLVHNEDEERVALATFVKPGDEPVNISDGPYDPSKGAAFSPELSPSDEKPWVQGDILPAPSDEYGLDHARDSQLGAREQYEKNTTTNPSDEKTAFNADDEFRARAIAAGYKLDDKGVRK